MTNNNQSEHSDDAEAAARAARIELRLDAELAAAYDGFDRTEEFAELYTSVYGPAPREQGMTIAEVLAERNASL